MLTFVLGILTEHLKVFKVQGNGNSSPTHPGVGFLGFYKNGLPHGHVWIETMGGGLLHGAVDESNHTLTGDNVSFVFPDRYSMFHGRFVDSKMVNAKEAKLKGIICQHGLPAIDELEIVDSETKYFYQPRTNLTFGGGPYGVVDPYEKTNFVVKHSGVPESGEGK